MKVKFTRAFGNFVPGDELEIPDGSIFDRSYLEEVVTEDVPVTAEDGDK